MCSFSIYNIFISMTGGTGTSDNGKIGMVYCHGNQWDGSDFVFVDISGTVKVIYTSDTPDRRTVINFYSSFE